LLIVLIAASLGPAAVAAENGLVAHWKMDQIADGVVADATGRGHDAKLGGIEGVRLEVAPGVIGNALQFRADQQAFLTVAHSDDLQLTRGLTVMAWIKPAARNKTYEILCNKADKGGNPSWPGWRMYFAWNRLYFQCGIAGGKELTTGSPDWSVPTGFWSHVAASFDGRTVHLYINGVERATSHVATPILPRRAALIIGNYVGRKNAYALDGLLDDVKVFDRPLTEKTIFTESVRGMAD
jgi:hypothetical protein